MHLVWTVLVLYVSTNKRIGTINEIQVFQSNSTLASASYE